MLNLHEERISVAMPKDALVTLLDCAYLYTRSRNDLANGAQIQDWISEMRRQLGAKGRISIKSVGGRL
jgi:hypothetical protein